MHLTKVFVLSFLSALLTASFVRGMEGERWVNPGPRVNSIARQDYPFASYPYGYPGGGETSTGGSMPQGANRATLGMEDTSAHMDSLRLLQRTLQTIQLGRPTPQNLRKQVYSGVMYHQGYPVYDLARTSHEELSQALTDHPRVLVYTKEAENALYQAFDLRNSGGSSVSFTHLDGSSQNHDLFKKIADAEETQRDFGLRARQIVHDRPFSPVKWKSLYRAPSEESMWKNGQQFQIGTNDDIDPVRQALIKKKMARVLDHTDGRELGFIRQADGTIKVFARPISELVQHIRI